MEAQGSPTSSGPSLDRIARDQLLLLPMIRWGLEQDRYVPGLLCMMDDYYSHIDTERRTDKRGFIGQGLEKSLGRRFPSGACAASLRRPAGKGTEGIDAIKAGRCTKTGALGQRGFL